MAEKFNPTDYLRTLTKRKKIKDPQGKEQWVEEEHQYLDVKYRVVWFRQIYPDGFIDTIESEVTDKLARIEATVYDKDPSHGGKQLGKGRRQIKSTDFKDYVEKAETQAIGRALAIAGFGTQFCDDLDEGDSLADSPVEANKQTNQNHPDPEINPNAVYNVASIKGLSKDDTNIIIRINMS